MPASNCDGAVVGEPFVGGEIRRSDVDCLGRRFVARTLPQPVLRLVQHFEQAVGRRGRLERAVGVQDRDACRVNARQDLHGSRGDLTQRVVQVAWSQNLRELPCGLHQTFVVHWHPVPPACRR